MPEPGINDPDFNRPTTKSVRGPTGGQLARKRRRAPIKLPGEYAEFQLNDGRLLGDVLGEAFFVPESGSGGGEIPPENPLKQTPKDVSVLGRVFEGNPRFSRGPASAKRALDHGDAPVSGASKGAPEGIGAPSGRAMPDDDNEAGFTNLPFGTEEEDMAAGYSVSGQRPGAGGIENPGRLEQAGKPEFTSADIPDPRDRREFESLEIAMLGAERKIALHEDSLDLYERRFKNKRIDARAMDRARRYFEFRIGQQEALIARSEDRLTEIRAAAPLDAAALSSGDTPRAEDGPVDGAPAFPTARPRPADIGSGRPGGAEALFNSDGGFWMFELPLTADGGVDEDALAPGSVYRIPDSAGGGTGQWKNGAFYNFDQKGDWRLRTAADLDAYSGASDAPTPEERWEQTKDAADKALMPAAYLNNDDIQEFTKKTGYGLTRGEGGLMLTDPSGRELLDLAEEDAAELARIWSPEVAERVAIIGLLWREDLTPAEKRRLLAEAIGADKLGPAPEYNTGRARAASTSRDAKRHLIELRMKAYDDLAAAMERGASDEDIGELLDDFHAAMLPEVFGTERFVRELLMDLVPGLGNVRSFRHLQNDIAEVERAMETGEWGDAAWAGGMAILDGIGIIPGGNLLKAGVKFTGRGLVKVVPHLDGLLAERNIRRFMAQWGKKVGTVSPKRFVGELLDELDPNVGKKFKGLVNDRVGEVSEDELFDLGKKMDPNARREVRKMVPDGFQIETRIYDMEATFLSDVITAKNATLGRLARWIANAGDEATVGTKVGHKELELKTGDKIVPNREGDPDKYFNEHPDIARENYDVNEVIYLRKAPEEVSIDFVIDDLSQYLDGWVAVGRMDVSDARALKEAMNRMKVKGISMVGLVEYVGFLARLGAATTRHSDMSEGESAELDWDAYP